MSKNNRLAASILALGCLVWPLYGGAAQICNSHMTATTPDSQFVDNGDGTVTDKATGLTWMRCAVGQTWSSATSTCSGTAVGYTWQTALSEADGYSYAGHTDWRLPNDKELASLTERACYSPAINLDMFPNTDPSGVFWTSTPSAATVGDAWTVSMTSGNSRDDQTMTGNSFSVRLVRGGP